MTFIDFQRFAYSSYFSGAGEYITILSRCMKYISIQKLYLNEFFSKTSIMHQQHCCDLRLINGNEMCCAALRMRTKTLVQENSEL